MHVIAVLALPSVVAFDLAIPAQVFGHPDEATRYDLRVCGARVGRVTTTTGFDLAVRFGLDTLRDADTLVVPGYWPLDPPASKVLDAVRECQQRGARVVSICTGAFALAAAGVLDGRRVTTHWRDSAELARRYPALDVDADVLYLTDDTVFTSAGVAAGIDLCLEIMRRDHGADIAADAARRMVVAPNRTGGQAQFITKPLATPTDSLAPTCEWALKHLADDLTIAALAEHAGWAPRTFARRFGDETGTSPGRWLATQRLLHARRLLEGTDLPIEQVAARSGLGTAANLRLRLAAAIGLTPREYRRSHYKLSIKPQLAADPSARSGRPSPT